MNETVNDALEELRLHLRFYEAQEQELVRLGHPQVQAARELTRKAQLKYERATKALSARREMKKAAVQ